MKKILILIFFPAIMWSQGQKIGVRAGFDFSKFLGPLEQNESFEFSTGFHFGLNYTYFFTPFFGVGAELMYTQKGNKQNFSGEAFYPIHTSTGFHYEKGMLDYTLDISNGYVSLPITAHLLTLEKLEFVGGINFNFLINPVGNGLIQFESDPDLLFFEQILGYQYYTDDPLGINTTTYNPDVFLGEDIIEIPGSVGAYYHLDSELANEELFSWFDASLLFGVNYYINKSLFVGVRADYGLFDLTNDKADYSISTFNATDNSLIFKSDRDVHFGIQTSIGFRF